jgi:hypothetical protein
LKAGTENRTKTYIAIALFLVAVALVARWVFSSAESPTPVRASVATIPAQNTTPAAPAHASAGKKAAPAPRLDPTLNFNLLRPSEDTKYTGTGRNIFEATVEIPQPIASAVPKQTQPQPPPGPPPPPPINLKFYGFASQTGEAKKIFLAEGEDVFIAGEGDIVDRRYKILHISPTAVEIEDVLHNNRQSIPLTQS